MKGVRLKLGSKGIAIEETGKLIIAVVALAILFMFFYKISPGIKGAVDTLSSYFICKLCESVKFGEILLGFCSKCK